MKKNNFFKILIILLSMLAIITLNGCKSKNEGPKAEYIITFNQDSSLSKTSVITITGNNVDVSVTYNCKYENCEKTTEHREYTYSDENIDKLKKFINNNFNKGNIFTVTDKEITEKQNDVLSSILLSQYNFESAVEDAVTTTNYNVSSTSSYTVYIKSDNTIIIKNKTLDAQTGEIKNIKTYPLNFSAENLSLISQFLSTNTYKMSDYFKIRDSIINNNEANLTGLDTNVKLLYSVIYNNPNCTSPILYLYDDNTYELYYDKEISNHSSGKYENDLTSLIYNIRNNQSNNGYTYILQGLSETLTVNESNEYINEFLNSIRVNLKNCIKVK